MKTYFKDDELNYAPLIKARLRNPLSDKSLELDLMIDTGFQGGVLIPLHAYIALELNLLEEPKVIAKTAVGSGIELRASRVIVETGDSSVLCHAYTTLGVKRPLLGREVLKKIGLLYKPPSELRVGLR